MLKFYKTHSLIRLEGKNWRHTTEFATGGEDRSGRVTTGTILFTG